MNTLETNETNKNSQQRYILERIKWKLYNCKISKKNTGQAQQWREKRIRESETGMIEMNQSKQQKVEQKKMNRASSIHTIRVPERKWGWKSM